MHQKDVSVCPPLVADKILQILITFGFYHQVKITK